MKEIYRGVIRKNLETSEEVCVVLYELGHQAAYDATRYQLEVHFTDFENWNAFIIRPFLDRNRAIEEAVNLKQNLADAVSYIDPAIGLEKAVMMALDRRGIPYVTAYKTNFDEKEDTPFVVVCKKCQQTFPLTEHVCEVKVSTLKGSATPSAFIHCPHCQNHEEFEGLSEICR